MTFVLSAPGPVRRSLLACLLAAALSAGATSVAFAEVKIAVVDLQKVLHTSAAGKAAQKKFDDLRDKKKHNLEVTDKALQKRQKELVTGRAEIEDAIKALNGKPVPEDLRQKAAAFQDKAKDFEQDVMEFEKAQRTTVDDLAKKEADLLKPIEDTIKQKVEAIAKERGYGLVLSRQVTVYAADTFDITDEVIRRCDAK